MTNAYTPTQFALFRVIFGLYLAWHFLDLVPASQELFSQSGMIPDPKLNPTSSIFSALPIWYLYESSQAITWFLYSLIFSALVFASGHLRIPSSLYLWYGWVYLFNRNVFIANPGLPYVGWLMLACAIIPNNEGHRLFHNPFTANPNWRMPSLIYGSAWFLMALGYTISGCHKLQCPSWWDGSALDHVLTSVLARDNFLVQLLVASPPLVLKLHTWGSILAEILFLPIGIFDRVRKWYWLLWMSIQLGILATINFTDLTLGVLMIHLFTFDARWLKEKPFNFSSVQNNEQSQVVENQREKSD